MYDLYPQAMPLQQVKFQLLVFDISFIKSKVQQNVNGQYGRQTRFW